MPLAPRIRACPRCAASSSRSLRRCRGAHWWQRKSEPEQPDVQVWRTIELIPIKSLVATGSDAPGSYAETYSRYRQYVAIIFSSMSFLLLGAHAISTPY